MRVLACVRARIPERSAAGLERFAGAVAAVEDALGEEDFILGERFSIADVIVSSVLAISRRFEDPQLLPPRTADYLARMEQRPARVRAYAALAKFIGANWGHRSVDRLMQVFGGIGESNEHPLPHWYRLLRHGRIGGGTEAYLAYSEEPLAAGSEVLVFNCRGHRSVDVMQFGGGETDPLT